MADKKKAAEGGPVSGRKAPDKVAVEKAAPKLATEAAPRIRSAKIPKLPKKNKSRLPRRQKKAQQKAARASSPELPEQRSL